MRPTSTDTPNKPGESSRHPDPWQPAPRNRLHGACWLCSAGERPRRLRLSGTPTVSDVAGATLTIRPERRRKCTPGRGARGDATSRGPCSTYRANPRLIAHIGESDRGSLTGALPTRRASWPAPAVCATSAVRAGAACLGRRLRQGLEKVLQGPARDIQSVRGVRGVRVVCHPGRPRGVPSAGADLLLGHRAHEGADSAVGVLAFSRVVASAGCHLTLAARFRVGRLEVEQRYVFGPQSAGAWADRCPCLVPSVRPRVRTAARSQASSPHVKNRVFSIRATAAVRTKTDRVAGSPAGCRHGGGLGPDALAGVATLGMGEFRARESGQLPIPIARGRADRART